MPEKIERAAFTAVEASLSAREDREQLSPLWRPCEVVASLFMCGKDLTK